MLQKGEKDEAAAQRVIDESKSTLAEYLDHQVCPPIRSVNHARRC